MIYFRNTTTIPDEKILGILKFVVPKLKEKNYEVYVYKSPYKANGAFYWNYRRAKEHGTIHRIYLLIGPPKSFPCVLTDGKGKEAKGYIPTWVRNRIEALVMVGAHEMRHLWQYQNRKYGIHLSKKNRSRLCEQDADGYAIRMLKKWRNK